jgi:hypothetical protein
VEDKDQNSTPSYGVSEGGDVTSAPVGVIHDPPPGGLTGVSLDTPFAPEPLNSQEQPQSQVSLFLRLARRLDVALILLLVIGATITFIAVNRNSDSSKSSNAEPNQYGTIAIPLEELISGKNLALSGASNVSINGFMQLNNGFSLAPSLQPTGAKPGQIYYDQDTNQLAYFNGEQFVFLTSAPAAGVQSLGGATGQLTLGGGLSLSGSQLSSSGVLSVQGQNGDVTFTAGPGIIINGTNFSNSGVLSIAAGTPNVTVGNDGSGNITVNVDTPIAGTGTVTSAGGTAGTIPVFTANQNIEDSIITQSGLALTVNGSLTVTGSTTLNTALAVPSGGTGASSLASNGVLVGNGTSPIGSVAAGGAGLCLMSTAGAPTWGACPGGSGVASLNGLTGALSIANASGAGSTVTINDASTGSKGIASFNSTNFTVTAGAVNTIQNINSGATPTFAGLNTNSITPSGTLTVGATGQQLILQGNASSTFTATGGGFTTGLGFTGVPTGNVTYNLDRSIAVGTYTLCSTAGNCTGLGGGVTTAGGTVNTLAKFTGAQAIGDAIITDDGTTVSIGGLLNVTNNITTSGDAAINGGDITSTGALNITPGGALTVGVGTQTLTLQGGASTTFKATSGANTTTVAFATPTANTTLNFPALSAGTYTICTTSGNCSGAGVTLQTAYDNSTSPEITLDATRGALTVRDNATPIGANLLEVQNNTGSTTYLGVTVSGVSVAGTLTSTGTINTSAGALQTGGTTRLDNSGNLTNIGNLTATGAITVASTGGGNAITLNSAGTIELQDDTNVTGNFDVSGTLTAGTANAFQVAAGGSITTAGSATLQGGTVTVGTSSQAGTLILHDGSSNTGTLQTAALGQNTIYTLPDPGVASATICLDTGNCSGSAVTLQSAYNNSSSPEITLDATRGAVTIRDAATPLGANLLEVQNNGGGTTYFAATASGISTTGTTTSSGNINTTGGGLQTNSLTRVDNSGNLTNIGNITGTAAITIASAGAGNDITIDGADQFIIQDASTFNALATFNADLDVTLADTENVSITNTVTGTNAVDVLSTVLTNNTASGVQRVALLQNAAGSGTTEALLALDNADTDTAVASGLQITSAAGGVTNAIDVSDADIVNALVFGANDISGTNFTLTGSNGSIDSAGNATLQGGVVTIGNTTQAGGLVLHDGSSNTGTLQTAALGQNTIYTLPDPGVASATICLDTGNCAGSGGGIVGSGTTNRVAKFTASGTIGDSSISDNGSTVTTTGNLVVQGGTATLGTTSQVASLALHDGNGQTTTLQAGDSSGNLIFILPTGSGSANQCLKQSGSGNQLIWQDCDGGSGGSSATLQSAYNNGNTIATNDASDVAITLANTTTDANFTITTAAGSAGFTTLSLADGANATPAAQLLLIKNNDTNEVLAAGISVQSAAGGITTAFDASGANITNALAIGAHAITGTNFSVTSAGAVTAVGINAGTGLIQGTGGLTVTGTISLNNNSNNNVSINTGSSTGTITLGGGSAPLVIDSTNFDVSSGGALSGITTIATSGAINGQTISSAANFTGTVTIQGSNALTLGVTGSSTGAALFKGATAASGTLTLVGQSNPSNNTLTLPNETGTICTTGSICSGYQASGNYLVQAPVSTAINTVTPITASVVGLTVNATSSTTAVAVVANQSQTADTIQINTTNTTGTQTNGILFNRNGSGGTTTNGINVTNTAGTLTNGLSFAGTIGTDINRSSGTLSVSGNGGLSLQTGGSATINIGTANANTINIGTGANANTVHIADAVGTAQNVFLGSNGGSSATTTILGGSSAGGGGINIGASGATTITVGNSGSSGNSVDIQSGSSGSITVGASLGTQNVTIGSLGAASITNLRGGSTGGINVGVVGSATDSSTVHISDTSSSTGTQVVTIGSIAANAGNNTTIQGGSGSGAVSVQAAASGTISIGTTNNNTIAIGSTGNTLGIVLGQSTASNTINIGNGTTAAGNTQTVNIATSATSTGKATVTIGNTNGASSLTLQGGTNGISLLSAANVTIGTSDTTGTLLVLDTKTGVGDPTGVNGGMYYNSNADKFRCFQGSAWTDCITAAGGTLQAAYTASTGGTTPEIKLDNVRNGIDIQDADSTIGGGENFISMRAPNGSGLGNIVFGFGIQGNIYSQPTADSTTLWDINNSAGNNLLTLDSTNGRLGINLGGTTVPSDTLTVNGSTSLTGPTSGNALVVTNSSSTGSIAIFKDNSLSVLNIQDGGHFVFKSTVDNDNAYRFTNQTDDNVFSIDTSNKRLGFNLGGTNTPAIAGTGKGFELQGALRLSGGSGTSNNLTDLYTTPLGSTVRTKINVVTYDPSVGGTQSGAQVLALGISNCTDTTDLTTNCTGGAGVTNANARVITVLDARKGTANAAHQPSIGVISPDENQIFGFSWEGSNTIGYVKSIGTDIGIRVNTTDIATFSSSAVNLNMNTTVASGKTLTVTSGATSLTGPSGGSSTAATVATGAASNVGLKIQGASSQTADLLQLQDSTSSNIFRVDAAGNLESIGYFSNGFGGLGNFGNLLTFSEQFDNAAWTKTNVTAPTADTVVAPDGQTSAESLATSASGGSVSQTSGTAPTNNNYTFSVWLKSASGTQSVDLRIDGATTGTGTVKTVTARTTWQRFFVTQNTNGFTGNIKPLIFPGGTGGSGTVHAWGAQLILSSQPEVYVRATTTTVAANRGIVSNGGAFISSINASDIPLVVQGAPSQSGDLLQLQNSSGTVLANISSSGALGTNGLNTGSGILQGTGGLTLTGAVSVNNNANNNTSINTGTSTGTITLGGGSAPLVINSTNFDVSSAGAVSGITDYAQASGNFLQSGTGTFGTGTGSVSLNGSTTVASAKTFTVTSGATSLTGASTGDALTVSNDSSTGNIAVFKDNTTAVATLADGGAATFENSTNSTAAFRIQSSAGTTFFNADSTNKIITTTDMNVGSSAGSRLFSDSFEGNSFGLWDLGATNGGGGATATIDSTIKRNGNYSAKFVSGSGSNYYRANIKSTTGNIYMRGYVYVASHATADVNFFDVISGDGTTFSVGRKLSNGNMTVWDGTGGGVTHDTGVAFSTGTWHKVELRSNTASGGAVQGYLDGTLVGNYTSTGAVTGFNKILMGDDNGASTSTVYMDDISVDPVPTSTADGGGLNVQDSLHVSGSSTLSQTWLQPGSDSTAAFQVSNASGTALFSVDTTNSAVKLLTSGSILDLASGTAGNTATLKIPTRSSGTCSSAVSEGLVFRDSGGTQRGHACIDSGTPLLKFYANQFNATSTDVAENYSDIHNNLQPGDLVSLDNSSTPRAITKATKTNGSHLFGVVSTAPGILLSGIEESDGSTNLVNPKPIALSGRIPTKVSTENGAIAPGDFLTISSTPGVAMKATVAGMVIGRAVEGYTHAGIGSIEVVAQNAYYPGQNSADMLQNGHFSDLLVDGTLTTDNLVVTSAATVKDLTVTHGATIQTLLVVGDAAVEGNLTVQHALTTADLTVTRAAEVQQLRIGGGVALGSSTEDPTADIAHPITKRFKARKPIAAGTVVITDATAGWVTTTTSTSDKRVIGIAVSDAAKAGDVLEVAIGGTAQVIVDGNTAIGNLLHTSSTEGKVSAITGAAAPGEIVGKVLGSVTTDGKVLVLVTLE